MSNKISRKHQLFIDKYLQLMNGTQAYLAVYPKASYETAMANSSRLLGNAKISEAIDERLKQEHMTADKALRLLEDQAEGDIAKLMELTSVGGNVDLKMAQERGLSKLIKRYKQKTTTFIAKKPSDEDREVTELEIELHDAQTALRDILKMHGKLTEKLNVNLSGQVEGVIRIIVHDDNEKKDADGA